MIPCLWIAGALVVVAGIVLLVVFHRGLRRMGVE